MTETDLNLNWCPGYYYFGIDGKIKQTEGRFAIPLANTTEDCKWFGKESRCCECTPAWATTTDTDLSTLKTKKTCEHCTMFQRH